MAVFGGFGFVLFSGFTLDSPGVRPKESYIEFLLVILIYVFLTVKV